MPTTRTSAVLLFLAQIHATHCKDPSRLTFINGIRHTEAECAEAAEIIGQSFGEECFPLWNPTSGTLLDLSQVQLHPAFSSTPFLQRNKPRIFSPE
jgi:hypothetical protein